MRAYHAHWRRLRMQLGPSMDWIPVGVRLASISGPLKSAYFTLVVAVRRSRIPTTLFSRHAPHTRARGLQVRSYEARHVRNRYVVVGRGLLLAKCAEEVAPVSSLAVVPPTISSTCQKYAPDRTRAHNGAPAVSARRYGAKSRPGAELCTPVPFPRTGSGFRSQMCLGASVLRRARTAFERSKRAGWVLQVARASIRLQHNPGRPTDSLGARGSQHARPPFLTHQGSSRCSAPW